MEGVNGMNQFLLIFGLLALVVGGMFTLFTDSQSIVPTGVAIAGILMVGVFIVANWRQVARRSTFYGLNAVLMSAAFIAILSVVYLIAQNRDQTWDFTATGRYTLDPQTAKILDSLDRPVKILLFFSSSMRQSGEFVAIRDLMDEYKRRSSNVDYEVIDPEKDYDRAINYASDLNPLGTPTIIAEVEMDGRSFREKADTPNQEGVSNAIMKVTHREPVAAYFLVGNYEKELNAETVTGLALLKKFLEEENIEANELRIGAAGEIPEDADIIAVVGPEEDLTNEQIDALKGFVLKGGSLFLALDPGEFPNLSVRMRELGFELPNRTVIEMAVSYRSLDEMVRGMATASPSDKIEIDAFDAEHEITKPLGNSTVTFTTARAIGKIPALPEGVTIVDLAKTAEGSLPNTSIPRSWSTANPAAINQPGVTADGLFNPQSDNAGPITVLAAAEVDLNLVRDGVPDPDNPQRRGKILLAGDSDFLTNIGLQARGGQGILRSHHNLALNAFNWLAGQVDLITIREKQADNTSLIVSESQQKQLQVLLVWVLPSVIAAIGFAVVMYRRIFFV